MKVHYFLFALLILFTGCYNNKSSAVDDAVLFPTPSKVVNESGFLEIDSLSLFTKEDDSRVRYVLDNNLDSLGDEGYILKVDEKGVNVKAFKSKGHFYATMTLRQMYSNNRLPFTEIVDKPRFSYRGLMLDVSRHFYAKEEIKQLISWMSEYKLNYFHWHLTDDGGWRIEIDKYPGLTSDVAYRTHHKWQDWWKNGAKYANEMDSDKHGGYYTKEDIKEVIEYADEHNITVVPEIEFPGHSRAVLAAYPELSCSGEPYKNGAFCVGNEDAYVFMEDVLNEVMDLFPSEIIHIGGDETNSQAWKTCSKCQGLMETLDIEKAEDLHTYAIKRVEEIIADRGRRMAGWDEILDDGLDKSSIIMSWRGEQAGFEAAKNGYDVIMTPLHNLYIDYFQSNPEHEPLAHDGYTTLEKVYAYNPTPDDKVDEYVEDHILGIQGNLWTEWISDFDHLEYMLFPRIIAVAEIAWTTQTSKDWPKFNSKIKKHINSLSDRGINTYKLSDEVTAKVNALEKNKTLKVNLKSESVGLDIRYTLDGTTPSLKSDLYNEPVEITDVDSLDLKAATFDGDKQIGDVFSKTFYWNKAINKPITSSLQANNLGLLVNGESGSPTYLDGEWLNFSGDQEFIIDMEELTEISLVSTRWMQLRAGARRNLPDEVEVLFSTDGTNYFSGGVSHKKEIEDIPILQFHNYGVEGNWKARYIKLKIKTSTNNMSLDEITVL